MGAVHQNGSHDGDRSVFKDLFAPVDEEKVLIPGESIVYNERRHWAILIQPLAEMLGGLILITSMTPALASTGGRASIGLVQALVLVGVFGLILFRIRTGDWNRNAVYGSIAALAITYLVTGQGFVVAIAAILVVCGYFLYRVLYWLYYERLYITNRRIIMASAFLGSEISTMPLTRVTDISYKTTVTADILGYGILRVESAGQDQALGNIGFLEKPDIFYNKLIERTTAAVGSVTEQNDEDDGSGTLEP